jgi:hypothetical protein
VDIPHADVVIGTSDSHTSLDLYGDLTIHGDAEIVEQGGLTVTGPVSAKNFVTTSDERIKNIISPVTTSIEDIANVRIVDYKLKDNNDDVTYTGSIAQDW